MLRGRFGDTTKRPYIEGRLVISRLKLQQDISFCVDTGADKTTLTPADGILMGLDYSSLTEDPRPSLGLGGTSYNYVEPVVVIFSEARKCIHVYYIDLIIIDPDPDLIDLPSLLGRDILNRWTMRYSPTSDRLTFKVVTADASIPL